MDNGFMEYEIGNISTAFKCNTDKRISKDLLDPDIFPVYDVLQDELSKALRIIENAIQEN